MVNSLLLKVEKYGISEDMRWAAPAILVVSVLLSYAPVFQNGFVYDDHFQLERNPYIHDFHHLKEIFTRDVWSFSPGTNSNNYRPVHMLTYMLTFQAFGPNPAAYHSVNLLLYMASVLLLWQILMNYLEAFAAFAGALLFATHPVHAEAVAWIGGAHELLCGLFVFLSFLLYLRKKPALSIVSFVLALLSKETALVFPFVIAADYFLFRKQEKEKVLFWGGACAVVLVAYFVLRIHALGSFMRMNQEGGTLLFVAPVVFSGLYLGKLLLPISLNAFYHFSEPLPWSVLWPGLVLLVCGLVFLYVFRSKRVFVFGWLWFGLFLLPALFVKGVSPVLFADRYLYLPSAGFLLAVFSLAPRPFIVWMLLVVSILFGVASYERSRVWHDDLTLWKDTVEKSPLSATVNYNLGTAYMKQRDFQQASVFYERTNDLDPHRTEAYYNLAVCRHEMGDNRGAARSLNLFLRYSDPKDPLRKDVEFKLQQLLESGANR